MCKCIPELKMFEEKEDKEKYLSLLNEYKEKFHFLILGYCLMDNHCHIMIDANGADISKVFHGINQRFAVYYNKRHGREGHLFQDRFKSKIVGNERYLITLSRYIHANPKVIKEYEKRLEQYPYSSLGIYLGLRKDNLKLVSTDFILSYFNNRGETPGKAYLAYMNGGEKGEVSVDIELENEPTKYISYRKVLPRNFSTEKIMDFLKEKYGVSEESLRMKNSRKSTKHRAIFVLLMRCLCNYKHKDICAIIGNITQSRVSTLCSLGSKLAMEDEKYNGIISKFILENA